MKIRIQAMKRALFFSAHAKFRLAGHAPAAD